MREKMLSLLMPLVSKRELSHWVGRLVHRELPRPVKDFSVELFAKAFDLNMDEAERPLREYKSIGDLFTRRLKPGARPIGAWPVHPCDGALTECGRIESLQMIQAKGKAYSVAELLRSGRQALIFEGGAYFTYYLAPTDYHRVHSPVDGRVTWSSHAPGEMWPVNDWSVNAIQNLFGINERVSALFETARGRVALTMVAATNVGNIGIAFDDEIVTNKRGPGSLAAKERVYDPPIALRAGDDFGVFRMGSTVVMLYEKGLVPDSAFALKGRRTRMGEPLA